MAPLPSTRPFPVMQNKLSEPPGAGNRAEKGGSQVHQEDEVDMQGNAMVAATPEDALAVASTPRARSLQRRAKLGQAMVGRSCWGGENEDVQNLLDIKTSASSTFRI